MIIRLIIPRESVAFAKTKGLRLKSRERLRWTDGPLARRYTKRHPARPSVAVLLRGKSNDILEAGHFRVLHDAFDAYIETDHPWHVADALELPCRFDYSEFGIRSLGPSLRWSTAESQGVGAASSSGGSARSAPRARKAAPGSARRPPARGS